jgi:hypothetical protein
MSACQSSANRSLVPGNARVYVKRVVVAGAAVLALSMPSPAAAQTASVCGPEVKAELVKALAAAEGAPDTQKLALEKELYAKYQYCAQDAQWVSSSFVAAARQCGATVSNLGSTFYEEMPCVGYDPQRRQFAAPIKIKQTFGFGPAPLPGSREHVLHCVADAAGVLQPVGRDSVHLADAINQVPTWQFAVITNANQNLQTIYPLNQTTRRARSILSWAFTPTSCSFTPIWGNAVNYRIRLDQ